MKRIIHEEIAHGNTKNILVLYNYSRYKRLMFFNKYGLGECHMLLKSIKLDASLDDDWNREDKFWQLTDEDVIQMILPRII